MLLSNGFPYSKIRLKKFDFSPIDAPANIAKKLPSQRCSQPFLIAFSTSRTNGPRSLSRVKVGTHATRPPNRAHSGSHAETGAFRTGPLSLPSERSTRFGNPAWPDVRTANFAVFGSWPGVLPKNAESLRDSDALMRVAVPRRRGPGGLRDLFSFLSKLRLVCPVPDTSFGSPDAPACAVPVQAASQLVPFRLGVQWFSVETGRIFCYNFGNRVTWLPQRVLIWVKALQSKPEGDERHG